MSPAEFLFRGLGLPPPESPPVAVPTGTTCPLTGLPLSEGWPIQSVIPSSTGEWLDLLRGDVHGFFSDAAAACIQNDWNLGSRAIFRRPDGTFEAHYPLLARPKPGAVIELVDEATADPKRLKTLRRDGQGVRPCWSDLLRTLPEREGWQCLLLIATDPKKRVWNRARVGTVGERTPFFLFDSSRNLLTHVHAPLGPLLTGLELVEQIYSAGFTKRAIETGLLSETRAIASVGHPLALAWEVELVPLRREPWFPVLTICAQKTTAAPLAPAAVATMATPTIAPTIKTNPTTTTAPETGLGGLFDV